MTASCSFAGCTVDQTKICALENVPDNCPHRISVTVAPNPDRSRSTWQAANPGDAVLSVPTQTLSFPSSTTLGIDIVGKLMAKRYVTVVGILGEPESGKTAALASLYLLVANAKLQGWSFADSQSLLGFEDIARGSREWNLGNPSDQMTVHTHLSDDRSPGFLHLRLRKNSDGRCVDFALPDLPGEWTQGLVRTAKWERLNFLCAADVIWIFADGRTLADRETMQALIVRLGQLAGRLKASMPEGVPRLILVVTHRDTAEVPAATLDRVRAEFARYDQGLEVVEIASFAKAKKGSDIKPGYGLAKLIDITITPASGQLMPFWPDSDNPAGQRSYLAYRRDR